MVARPAKFGLLVAPPADFTVTLDNPNGRLSIITPNGNSSLSLPADGTHRTFTIRGLQTSAKPNDAIINANRILPGNTQHTEGSAKSTVWQLLDPHVSVTPLSAYTFDGDFLRPLTKGVKLLATHQVKPTGLDPSSPPFKNKGVAIVQNVTNATYTNTFAYATYVLSAGKSVPAGSCSAPKIAIISSVLPRRATDVADGVAGPLYAGFNGYVNICNGIYSDSDSPQMPADSYQLDLKYKGSKVGQVLYTNTNLSLSANLVTYVADYDYNLTYTTPRREVSWGVNAKWNLSSTINNLNQKASVPNPNDQAISPTPVLDKSPSANDLLASSVKLPSYSGKVLVP